MVLSKKLLTGTALKTAFFPTCATLFQSFMISSKFLPQNLRAEDSEQDNAGLGVPCLSPSDPGHAPDPLCFHLLPWEMGCAGHSLGCVRIN